MHVDDQTPEQAQQRLLRMLNDLDGWIDRYHFILDQASRLATLPLADRTARYRVPGCTSAIWLRVDGDASSLVLSGASDCPMDAGLLAMTIGIYSGHSAEDIVSTPATFMVESGLSRRLTAQRVHGQQAIVARIRRMALDVLLHARVPVGQTQRPRTGAVIPLRAPRPAAHRHDPSSLCEPAVATPDECNRALFAPCSGRVRVRR